MTLKELTKEEILTLTNKDKRLEFLRTWRTWPVFVRAPEINMTVHIVRFPDGCSITATCFGDETDTYAQAHYRRHTIGHQSYGPYFDTGYGNLLAFLLGQYRQAKEIAAPDTAMSEAARKKTQTK